MAEKLKKGLLITFDGPEGCGKSTHSVRIKDDLEKRGYDVIHTREPGGTLLGERIRDILLEKDEILLGKEAELFLFEADRAQHVEEIIEPALHAKKIVICDRFSAATFAYQGYALGTDIKMIFDMDYMATKGIVPDLTILLDVDVETGLKRANGQSSPDRMEKRPREFHEKVRQGYFEIAEECPRRIKLIETRENIDETFELVKKEIDAFLQ
ncbi:MAG: dTMP kinase [Candidatus Omnitrophica bacterium]|nr:dTMP kinase [Candidatus Omnitrophota bacterium]